MTELADEGLKPAEAPAGGLVPVVEAVLFVATAPVSARRLAEVTGASPGQVRAALAQLAQHLADGSHGVELRAVAGGYRLFTKKAFGQYVAGFLRPVGTPLSGPAMETLAVIAYKQPITRAEIEAIRGVGCERSLRTLLERNLIRETGRMEAPGRPIVYGTTREFLEHFGLADLSQLPPPETFGQKP